MAALVCKDSVRFKAFTPALMRLLSGTYRVAKRAQTVPEVVITSANDSVHGKTSRHYKNEALDFRTRNFPDEAAKLAFADALRAELGPAFTVLYEDPGGANQHLHAQPRRGTRYDDTTDTLAPHRMDGPRVGTAE